MKFGSKANKINSQENKNTVRGKEAGHQTLLKRMLGVAAVAAAVISFGIGSHANADEVKTETTPQTELVNKSNEAASAAQASEVAASTSANETNLGSVDASKVNANNTNNTNQNVDLGYSSTAETTQAAKETTVAETKETVANAQQAEADQKAAAEQAATKAAAEQEAAAQEAAKAAAEQEAAKADAAKAAENTQPAAETHTQTPVETPQKAPETPAKEQEKPAPVENKTETNVNAGNTVKVTPTHDDLFNDNGTASELPDSSHNTGSTNQNGAGTADVPVSGNAENSKVTDKNGNTVNVDRTETHPDGKTDYHVDGNGPDGKHVSGDRTTVSKGGEKTPTPTPVNPSVNPPEKKRKQVNPQTSNAPVIPRVAKGNLPPTGENDALEAIMNATGASMLAALAVLEILRRRKQAGNKAK